MAQEREPERLLSAFQNALKKRGTSIPAAIFVPYKGFVPPDSLYTSPIFDNRKMEERDLSWQMRLRESGSPHFHPWQHPKTE